MRPSRWAAAGLLATGVFCGCGGGDTPSSPLPTMNIATGTGATTSVQVQAVVPSAPAGAASKRAAELLSKGRLNDALAQAQQGVRETPGSAEAFETLATVHHRLGWAKEAAADFSEAIRLEPKNPRLLNNRGFLWLSQQKFDEALRDFDAAIALDPTYPNSYNNRGLLQIAQGRYRQAVLDLDQALQVNPNYVDAYNNRGFALMHLGVWERALGDFQRALALDPKNVNALANRGFAKQNLGDTTGAILDFTAAMVLDPDNPQHYVHRREAYLREGMHDKAQQDAAKVHALRTVKQLNDAVAAEPQKLAPYVARARHFRKQGQLARAYADLTKAIERFPDAVDPRVERAALALEMQDFAAAEGDCNIILAQQPHQRAFSLRGDSRLELGNIDGAIADFESAKRLDNRVAEAYLLKGDALAKTGNAAAAAEFRQRAQDLETSLAAVNEAVSELRPLPEPPEQDESEDKSEQNKSEE